MLCASASFEIRVAFTPLDHNRENFDSQGTMNFTLDDDTVLKVSAVGTAAFGVHFYGAPKDAQASSTSRNDVIRNPRMAVRAVGPSSQCIHQHLCAR